MKQIMLYCRPGFEAETGAEFGALAEKYENWGFIRADKNSGFVIFVTYQPAAGQASGISFSWLRVYPVAGRAGWAVVRAAFGGRG